MPFVRCVFSGDEAKKGEIAKALSSHTSIALKKPEQYVCVHVEYTECLLFGGSSDPCCFIQIESIGGSLSDLVGPLTAVMADVAGIPSNRVFMNFTNMSRDCFALDGSTF